MIFNYSYLLSTFSFLIFKKIIFIQENAKISDSESIIVRLSLSFSFCSYLLLWLMKLQLVGLGHKNGLRCNCLRTIKLILLHQDLMRPHSPSLAIRCQTIQKLNQQIHCIFHQSLPKVIFLHGHNRRHFLDVLCKPYCSH